MENKLTDPRNHIILSEMILYDFYQLEGETVKRFYESYASPNTSADDILLLESGRVLCISAKVSYERDFAYIIPNTSIQKDMAVELGLYEKEDLETEIAEYEKQQIEEKALETKSEKDAIIFDLQQNKELLEHVKQFFNLKEISNEN